MSRRAERTWLRSNRWWLAGLPLAVVAMVAASSYQVRTFWWSTGLHHTVASAEPGRAVTATLDYADSVGPTSRTLTASAVGIETVDEVPSTLVDAPPVPDGSRAVAVTLDLSADPDQSLVGCQLLLVDDEGRRYGIPDDSGQDSPCVPAGQEGPSRPISATDRRGEVLEGHDRPGSWTVAPVFLVPDDATITTVLLWWEYPDHLELALP